MIHGLTPFVNARAISTRGLLWTYDAEASAAAERTSDRNFDLDCHNKPFDEGDIDEDGLEILQDAEEREEDWEEWYYQVAVQQQHNERKNYGLLTALQGDTIPRCFGTGFSH